MGHCFKFFKNTLWQKDQNWATYYTNFLILATYFLSLLLSHINLFFPVAAASHPNSGIYGQLKDSGVPANLQLFSFFSALVKYTEKVTSVIIYASA